MRLRNVPGAREVMIENEFVFTEPENMAGTWKEVFGNNNPVRIEIGMGKGRFITTLAQMNPDINYIGIEKYRRAYKLTLSVFGSNLNYHRVKIPCYLYHVPSGISWKEHLLYEDEQTFILPYPPEFFGGNQLLGRHARPELRLQPPRSIDANHGCLRNADLRLQSLRGTGNRLP